MVEQGRPLTPGVAQAAHAQGGGERARHAMTHGVRDRQVQDVASEAVVERVTADVRGRLQPGREREGATLAGERGGEQAALDLSGQGEERAPLAPLEEVGVATVRDDHEAPAGAPSG